MRTLERAKVMGNRAIVYENFRACEGEGRPGYLYENFRAREGEGRPGYLYENFEREGGGRPGYLYENFRAREGDDKGDRAISMRISESAKVMTRATGISL